MTGTWPIPSSCFGKTSETVGFFECAPSKLGQWIAAALGEGWTLQPERTVESETALRELGQQREQVSNYLIVAAANWSAVFTNGPLGTDVGVLPSRAARDLGVRAVRAVSTTAGTSSYETFIFEVFEPESPDQQRLRRSVYAADEGGTWRFGSSGEPFDFEDVKAYGARRKRDRLTGAMVVRYLTGMGISTELPSTVKSVSIERSSGL